MLIQRIEYKQYHLFNQKTIYFIDGTVLDIKEDTYAKGKPYRKALYNCGSKYYLITAEKACNTDTYNKLCRVYKALGKVTKETGIVTVIEVD